LSFPATFSIPYLRRAPLRSGSFGGAKERGQIPSGTMFSDSPRVIYSGNVLPAENWKGLNWLQKGYFVPNLRGF
jgi:hypothetical protein